MKALGTGGEIRRAQVTGPDPVAAVGRLHAALAPADDPAETALVLFFCSPDLDPARVSVAMSARFAGIPLVGCTTAGEIGPDGYRTGTLVGVSLPASDFSVSHRRIAPLAAFGPTQARAVVQALLQEQDQGKAADPEAHCFALLLVDGLSGREEPLTRTLQAALGGIPLVGGSASDGLAYAQARVHVDGRLHVDSAVLLLVRTLRAVQAVMTHHFEASDRRVVVTRADAAERIVHEIDGLPAAEAYAALVGVAVDALDAATFAAAPMAVLIGGVAYIRSINQVLPDGSLSFHCAIDEGMVLRVTRGEDLLGNLRRTFAQLTHGLGPPALVIGCDCILRRLEIAQSGLTEGVSALMRQHRVVGFNTYGEQFRGVHVNQTFTAIAIGGGGGGGGGGGDSGVGGRGGVVPHDDHA